MSKVFASNCPACKVKNVSFSIEGYYFKDDGRGAFLGVCASCGDVSTHYFDFMVPMSEVGRWITGHISGAFIPVCKPISIMIAPEYPCPDIPEFLPDSVKEDYEEAEECYGNDKTKKSAARAYRASIEAALKDKGAKDGNILRKIELLYKEGILTVTLRDFAHTIRIIGNDAAHGDSISAEELKDVRVFAKQLMTYLYTLPAQIPLRVQEKISKI